VVEHCKISNSKHQIPTKSQIPIFNDKNRFGIFNFGHCDLFEICYLLFGIFGDSSTPVLQNSSQSLPAKPLSSDLRMAGPWAGPEDHFF